MGYIAWGAGSLATNALLSLTPTKVGSKWVDAPLASQCVIAPWVADTNVTEGQSAVPTGVLTLSTSSASSTTSGSAATTTAADTEKPTETVAITTSPAGGSGSGSGSSKSGADGMIISTGLLMASFLLAFVFI